MEDETTFLVKWKDQLSLDLIDAAAFLEVYPDEVRDWFKKETNEEIDEEINTQTNSVIYI